MTRCRLAFFFDGSSNIAPAGLPADVLHRSPRPVSSDGFGRTKTPLDDNPVPGCNIRLIARFLITTAAFLSAWSVV